ncbi:competence type IV pilus assembly protein ComGB [Fervidibacillus halotolerans]|uniref:Competence type IV pilus assembly protein ComGB n=1 Tax=Fervidibacillus halotolerans TaxID=2980027 RepID=A0A9E8LXM9_9BACI|nr:competence type IV pilus assembly protein ComGB [Fervidibacillus halotolerans]WAA11449.1 competence type IV pilus assembly protein ComGB [Fervidibacillus halotolerans]
MGKEKWSIKDQSIFFKRLSTLLDEGYTMNDAIRFLSIQAERSKRASLKNIEIQLKNGNPFYEVLKEMKCHPISVSFCFYGEQNGRLSDALQTAAEILQRRYEDRMKLEKLAAYPFFLLLLIGILFFFFQWLLLPQFQYLYQSFQIKPNLFLSILFWINAHPVSFLFIILIPFLLVLYLFYWMKGRKTSYEFQCMLVAIPFVGSLVRLMNTYYIAYQFSQFLKNGLSLAESLAFIKKDPGKHYLSECAERIEGDLLMGIPFDQAISKIPFWQPELVYVIRHGQMSGKLDLELESFSRYCMESFSENVERLMKFLQPTIFFFIGIWLIFLYFSLLSPSFQFINEL